MLFMCHVSQDYVVYVSRVTRLCCDTCHVSHDYMYVLPGLTFTDLTELTELTEFLSLSLTFLNFT